jgi:hypothetical protein
MAPEEALMNNETATDTWKDMPWWVKAIVIIGFPTMVATGSLYVNYLIVVGQLAEHEKSLLVHNLQVTPHVHESTASHVLMVNALFNVQYTLTKLCQHQSHNERERDECIPPPMKGAIP